MKTHRGFWDWYAGCYDGLRQAIPYQRLLDQVADRVPVGTIDLLDAGCGTGNLLQLLRKRHPTLHLHGVDSSPAMLARAKAKTRNAELQLSDLNRALPYQDGSFDAVTCINVLYAVADPGKTVAELRRILKEGGILIVSSPLPLPGITPIVRAHAAEAGWHRTLPLIGRILTLVMFNLFIVGRRQSYHFLEEKSVEHLFGSGTLERTYGGQNWFVCVRKERNGFKKIPHALCNLSPLSRWYPAANEIATNN